MRFQILVKSEYSTTAEVYDVSLPGSSYKPMRKFLTYLIAEGIDFPMTKGYPVDIQIIELPDDSAGKPS